MTSSLLIPLAIAAIALLWFFVTYNGLVANRNRCNNAESSIDVNLKKRHDLIPNLVAAVKGFMTHERSVLEEVTKLRSQAMSTPGMTPARMSLENQITGLLGQIQMRAEAYPDLKSGENFLHLQRSLTELEEQISASRRAYNAAVESLNNSIQMVPSNIVAGIFKFEPRLFFEATDDERANVRVDVSGDA